MNEAKIQCLRYLRYMVNRVCGMTKRGWTQSDIAREARCAHPAGHPGFFDTLHRATQSAFGVPLECEAWCWEFPMGSLTVGQILDFFGRAPTRVDDRVARHIMGAGSLYQNGQLPGCGSLPSSVRGQVALDRRTNTKQGGKYLGIPLLVRTRLNNGKCDASGSPLRS
jgi:hypothetical protein